MAQTNPELDRIAPYIPARISVDSLVDGCLAFALLISFVVFIEPAPYEVAVLLLGIALFLARAPLPRALAPLILTLGLLAVFGAFSALQVTFDSKAIMYYLITVYFEISVVIFAVAFAQHPERRLAVLERWYIRAAVLAALLGIIGYFATPKGGESLLLLAGRAKATFKDPNVYGPFLVLPVLFLLQRIIYDRFRLSTVITILVILLGLFLSFSRGAWGHLAGSGGIMLALMFFTNRDPMFRLRLINLSVLGVLCIAALLALLLSFSSLSAMFTERVNLTNYYDQGEAGRFGNQLRGFLTIFDYPNGTGPRQFKIMFGNDPHNTYLAAFYAYGWGGGIAYAVLVALTLWIGLKGALVKTPWQAGLIAIYGTYVGDALESFIIDTDHWRHYFLLMGGVWGFAVASLRAKARQAPRTPSASA